MWQSVQRDARKFSTDYHIRSIKEERWDGKQDQDVENDVKLWGIIRYQGAFDKRFLLRERDTGSCLSIWGTAVTDTVHSTSEFYDFNMIVIMVIPLTLKISVTVAYRPVLYVTR